MDDKDKNIAPEVTVAKTAQTGKMISNTPKRQKDSLRPQRKHNTLTLLDASINILSLHLFRGLNWKLNRNSSTLSL